MSLKSAKKQEVEKATSISRRTFVQNSALLSAGSLLAGELSAQPASATIITDEVSEDPLLSRRRDDRSTRLAAFAPVKGPVPNPGMGITGYVYSDHMHVGYTDQEWQNTQGNVPTPLDKKSLDRMCQLPYVDKLYIRFDWREVQREKGRITIPDTWQWLLEAVEKYRKSWGFRVMNCSPHSLHTNSLPDFLQGRFKMVPYWHQDNVPGPRPKYVPAYNSEYLNYWEELVHLLAQKFDSHPLLEFVDVSGYGFWGEWHHGAWWAPDTKTITDYVPPNNDEVVARIIDAHLHAFTKTPAVLGLIAANFDAGRKAFEQGLVWARRDSFPDSFSTTDVDLAQGIKPGTAMLWETLMPMTPTPIQAGSVGQSTLQQRYFDVEAHYTAIGFNPWDMIWAHENLPDVLVDIEQQVGYRIRPAMIWHRKLAGQKPDMVLGLKNDGCAPPPGVINIQCRFPDGSTSSITLPPGTPAPGGMKQFAIPFPSDQAATVKGTCVLSMSIRLKQKSLPVQWAVEPGTHGTRTSLTFEWS